jgi:hypothetical protein
MITRPLGMLMMMVAAVTSCGGLAEAPASGSIDAGTHDGDLLADATADARVSEWMTAGPPLNVTPRRWPRLIHFNDSVLVLGGFWHSDAGQGFYYMDGFRLNSGEWTHLADWSSTASNVFAGQGEGAWTGAVLVEWVHIRWRHDCQAASTTAA